MKGYRIRISVGRISLRAPFSIAFSIYSFFQEHIPSRPRPLLPILTAFAFLTLPRFCLLSSCTVDWYIDPRLHPWSFCFSFTCLDNKTHSHYIQDQRLYTACCNPSLHKVWPLFCDVVKVKQKNWGMFMLSSLIFTLVQLLYYILKYIHFEWRWLFGPLWYMLIQTVRFIV